MESSSEYLFPIFISSTDYNLKDLRAELARFLSELGYRPILSSSEGFPDNSPNLEPWESCIPVLDKSFVMILVIDGKYGSKLPWPNSGELFLNKEISPTHGEYYYAHKNFKRMLVFIRSEVITYYQAYRQILKSMKGKSTNEIEEAFEKMLPEYIDLNTLKFVHEVKTTKPIPWIKEFDDITSIKKEVQKKMLNELAEIFLVKNMHLEIVVQSFNKVLQSLSSDEQTKALQKINVAKELTEKVSQIEEYQKELESTKQLLHSNQQLTKTQKSKYNKEILDLNSKISKLENASRLNPKDQFYIENGKIQLNDLSTINSQSLANSTIFSLSHLQNYNNDLFIVKKDKCDSCNKQNDYFSNWSIENELHKCNNCARNLCGDCFSTTQILINGMCSECLAKKN